MSKYSKSRLLNTQSLDERVVRNFNKNFTGQMGKYGAPKFEAGRENTHVTVEGGHNNRWAPDREFQMAQASAFYNPPNSIDKRKFSSTRLVAIVTCLFASVLCTMPEYQDEFLPLLYYFEVTIVIWFSAEFCLRLWSCGCRSRYQGLHGRLKYLTGPFCIIDMIVISASLVIFSMGAVGQVFATSAIRGLRFFQILRVVRIDRRGGTWKLLGSVVWAHRQELITTYYIGFLGLILASFLVYMCEKGTNDELATFADALWWGVITLCTVGYGDRVPKTWCGKITASFCALLGISFFALPAGILGSGFALKVQQQQRQKHLIRRRIPAASLIQTLWRVYASSEKSTSLATWSIYIRKEKSRPGRHGAQSTFARLSRRCGVSLNMKRTGGSTSNGNRKRRMASPKWAPGEATDGLRQEGGVPAPAPRIDDVIVEAAQRRIDAMKAMLAPRYDPTLTKIGQESVKTPPVFHFDDVTTVSPSKQGRSTSETTAAPFLDGQHVEEYFSEKTTATPSLDDNFVQEGQCDDDVTVVKMECETSGTTPILPPSSVDDERPSCRAVDANVGQKTMDGSVKAMASSFDSANIVENSDDVRATSCDDSQFVELSGRQTSFESVFCKDDDGGEEVTGCTQCSLPSTSAEFQDDDPCLYHERVRSVDQLTSVHKNAIRFIRRVRYFVARRKFKEALRPYDVKDVIEQYSSGHVDLLSRVKQVQSRFDLILGKLGSSSKDIFDSKPSLAFRIVSIERQVNDIEAKLDLLVGMYASDRQKPSNFTDARQKVLNSTEKSPVEPSKNLVRQNVATCNLSAKESLKKPQLSMRRALLTKRSSELNVLNNKNNMTTAAESIL